MAAPQGSEVKLERTEGRGGSAKSNGTDGWQVVGKGQGVGDAQKSEVQQKTRPKQSARKPSPRKSGAAVAGGTKKGQDTKLGAEEPDACVANYEQLRRYVINDAPADYVMHSARRQQELERKRRRNDYISHLANAGLAPEAAEVLLAEWTDDTTVEQQAKYKGLKSYWKEGDPQHKVRLAALLREWMLKEKVGKDEVVTRLRFLHFDQPKVAAQSPQVQNKPQPSYLNAVQQGSTTTYKAGMTEEQKRMYDLCLKPFPELSKLRLRTEDENKALLMVINHEIEVPEPPRFLVQTMEALALVRFTDIVMELEYPMYAHLAAGQRYSANMSKGALLAQISVGAEAAPQQKHEVQEFKESLSRISLDMDSRVINVTFKGKKAAVRWTNWNLPMGRRLLPLVDYQSQREAAKITHELIRLDYYDFTVLVKRGAVTETSSSRVQL